MRVLTLVVAVEAAAPAALDAEAAASSPAVLLLELDPALLSLLSLLFRFPLREVEAGVDGGNFLTRSIVLKRCLQQGHLFSVSAH